MYKGLKHNKLRLILGLKKAVLRSTAFLFCRSLFHF